MIWELRLESLINKKSRQLEQKIYSEEINQKVMVKGGRLKCYRNRNKKLRAKLDFPKQQNKIRSTIRRKMDEDIPATRHERGKKYLEQNMGTEKS